MRVVRDEGHGMPSATLSHNDACFHTKISGIPTDRLFCVSGKTEGRSRTPTCEPLGVKYI